MSANLLLEPVEYRTVVLHYHLMKNAGTTIAAVLEREFAGGFSEVHRDDVDGRIFPEELVALLRRNPELSAVSSHHFVFPVPRVRGFAFIDICPIRHPIDRLESLYMYFRLAPHGDELSTLAGRFELGGFLRIALDRFPNYTQSVQTIALGSERVLRPAGGEDLRRAIETVRRAVVVAVVERLDESLCAAEYYLRPGLPNLQLHYVAHNVTRDPRQPLEQKLGAIEARCSASLLDELRVANRADLALYEATNAELDRRIEAIPAFEARLAKFRERCAEAATRAAAGTGL